MKKYEASFKILTLDSKTQEQDIEEMNNYFKNIDTLILKVDSIVNNAIKFKENITNAMQSYHQIITQLGNYEKEQLIEYVDWNPKQLFIAKDAYQDSITQFGENIGKWAGPFRLLELWSKEEKHDLIAFKETFDSIKQLQVKRDDCTKKLEKLHQYHEKLRKGEFTFSGIIGKVSQKSQGQVLEESSIEIKSVSVLT